MGRGLRDKEFGALTLFLAGPLVSGTIFYSTVEEKGKSARTEHDESLTAA